MQYLLCNNSVTQKLFWTRKSPVQVHLEVTYESSTHSVTRLLYRWRTKPIQCLHAIPEILVAMILSLACRIELRYRLTI